MNKKQPSVKNHRLLFDGFAVSSYIYNDLNERHYTYS